MNRISERTKITVLICVLLVAGLAFFVSEYVTQADDWVVFPGSPHIYNGGNIGTGSVVDRDGAMLLDMNGGRNYSDSEILRKATVHWMGDRNGSVNAPALSHFSAEISGFSLTSGLYHYGNEESVARLTLLAQAQTAALEAMENHSGTVAVYNYKTGELLCAVTTPTFDPDNVPDVSDGENDSIFVNRFVQGTYVPGSIFKIFTLAAALEENPEICNETFSCSGALEFGPDKLTCDGVHGVQDLKHAFRNSCNVTFATIAQQLGADTLLKYAEKFGIVKSIQFDGVETASGNFDIAHAEPVNLGWAAIGQYTDQVNPASYLSFMGAIANDGVTAPLHLVEDISAGGSTTYRSHPEKGERIMSEQTARTIQEFMRFNVQDKYGDGNFPGLHVCAKTGTGEVGGDRKPNAMFSGFVQDPQYPLAFIACIEDGGYGSTACIPVVSHVLSVCQTIMQSR